MEHLLEELTEMVERTVEEEGKLSILFIHGTSSFANTFVPYECNFENCIYIEGDNATLNLENIDGIEITFDIDEYQISNGDEIIIISRI